MSSICPDCNKEINEQIGVCCHCGKSFKSENKTSTSGFFKTGFLLIIIAIFAFFKNSVSIQPIKNEVKNPVFASKNEANKDFEAEEALSTAIKFTRGHENRTIEMKIIGYGYALEELQALVQKYPNFKKDEIASLSAAYVEAKKELEEQKLGKERKEKEELELAEKEKKKNQEKIATAIKKHAGKFQISTDRVERTNFYRHKSFPAYTNSRSAVFPYIGSNPYRSWLRIQIQYTSDDWLFVESLVFSIDGEKTYKTFKHWDWQRDNGGGDIWEWVDLSCDQEYLVLLEKIAASKEAILRFSGKQYRHDLIISAKDKKAIQETLDLYKLIQNI